MSCLQFHPIESRSWSLCGFRVTCLKDSEGRILHVISDGNGFGGFRLVTELGTLIESHYGKLEVSL